MQQHTVQLTEKYTHLSEAYTQLKASQAQQRVAYEQLGEMVMNMAQGGTCAPNPFWPYDNQPLPPPPPPAPPLY